MPQNLARVNYDTVSIQQRSQNIVYGIPSLGMQGVKAGGEGRGWQHLIIPAGMWEQM